MSFNFGGTPSLGSTSTPARGNFSFGNTFGTATSTAPAFGTTSGINFGQSVPASTPALGFGSFGTNTITTSTPQLTGFGGFGTNTSTSAAPSFFGATPASNAPTAFTGFGASTATSSAPAFGGFGGFGTSSTTTTPAFGTQQTSNYGGFGSTFGKPATTQPTSNFGGFGSSLGQPQQQFQLQQQQQQQQQQLINADEAFAQSIFNVNIFGDERDTIIAKWNYLQAMWGTGKSFYSQYAAPVEITPQNYLCRFKAMGYTRLPGKDNKMGLVALNFNKTLPDIKIQQQQILGAFNTVLGNKPNLVINIESMKENDDKKSQIIIYVEEKSQMSPNETKRILATDLSNYLNQANIKQQLNGIGITEILALDLPDEDQLKEYLENPPKGIDPRMWRQAKLDNPDPTKFIPVPMIGFHDLRWRIKCQENETENHSRYLNKVERDLTELKIRHTAASAKIREHKRKLAELSHNILKIVVGQECTRKIGMALSPEEEALRSKLENMQALLSAPTQFKGRISELLSQMRMQRNQFAVIGGPEYTIDKDSEDEMKVFLSMQQKAMEVLTATVTKDLKALQIITEGMSDLVRG